jgi:hypothetical protein
MSRRRRDEGEILSLDSFLNIVTIAVGGLILVALVTVLGVGDVSVASGATAHAKPRGNATRVLFEAAGGRLYLLDEEGNGKRVVEAMQRSGGEPTGEALVTLLREVDTGDTRHRVLAELIPGGIAWVYELRDDAPGETMAELGRAGSAFEATLASMDADHFVYFVVHDDSFDVFGRARDLATARGVPVGWHPVEGDVPVRLSRVGALGKRVQ